MAIQDVHDAAAQGDLVRLRELLRADPAAVNARDSSGRTALHVAAERGQLEAVRLLIASGANVNTRENNCDTSPLHDAVFFNFPDIVELLLASGANPNARDENGGTPLHVAASCGSRSFVRSSPGGQLPLEMASEHSAAGTATSGRMLKMLLAAGADRTAKRDDGMTPSQSAAQWGHQEAVEILTDRRAEG